MAPDATPRLYATNLINHIGLDKDIDWFISAAKTHSNPNSKKFFGSSLDDLSFFEEFQVGGLPETEMAIVHVQWTALMLRVLLDERDLDFLKVDFFMKDFQQSIEEADNTPDYHGIVSM